MEPFWGPTSLQLHVLLWKVRHYRLPVLLWFLSQNYGWSAVLGKRKERSLRSIQKDSKGIVSCFCCFFCTVFLRYKKPVWTYRRLYLKMGMFIRRIATWLACRVAVHVQIRLFSPETAQRILPGFGFCRVVTTYPLVNIQKTMNNHIFFMGQSTISMAIFNSKLFVTRGSSVIARFSLWW